MDLIHKFYFFIFSNSSALQPQNNVFSMQIGEYLIKIITLTKK